MLASSPVSGTQNSSGAKTEPASIRHITKVSNRAPKVVDAPDPDRKNSIHGQFHTSSRRHGKAVSLRNFGSLGIASPGIELVPFRQVAGRNSLRKDSILV